MWETRQSLEGAAETSTLTEVGISKNESMKWQQVAFIPERAFGERIAQGVASPRIREEVEALYGVTVSASHMSHLRHRLCKTAVTAKAKPIAWPKPPRKRNP